LALLFPEELSLSRTIDREALVAARETYERWVRSAHTGAHSRRTAEKNAAFFLPHLKPGMSLLDAGCGPGSITIGLARAVAPGHVTGVDVSSDSLKTARKLAEEQACANVSFDQHHLRSLPYEDGSFDAVFVHAVLQHVDEPVRILRELFRVMRPGGVIGLADADFDGSLMWPNDPLLERSTAITSEIRQQGDTRIGRRLRGLLAEAGFADAVGLAQAGVEGDANITALNGAFWANYYQQEPLIAYAVALRLTTREEMAAISEAWRHWGNDPGAFAARFWCQAVAFKPAPAGAPLRPPA
jgi:ubiquinone/menaquinone biosynthesis C-methylase UbiE